MPHAGSHLTRVCAPHPVLQLQMAGAEAASMPAVTGQSGSRWSCETLRAGFQHVKEELIDAEKKVEREIQDTSFANKPIWIDLV